MKTIISILLPLLFIQQPFTEMNKLDLIENNTIIHLKELPNLSGTYKRTKWGLYSSFEFKGKSTVVVRAIGLNFTAKYELDKNLIRIDDGKSGILLLEIKNSTTLIGQGVAKGTYVK